MYVEPDVLTGLVADADWLRESAVDAVREREDLHTSILAYAEVLVVLAERDRAGNDVDLPRAVADLLELVPVRPQAHEQAVLAAAAFVDAGEATPMDALHAGLVAAADARVLSTEGTYDGIGLDRSPLDPAARE